MAETSILIGANDDEVKKLTATLAMFTKELRAATLGFQAGNVSGESLKATIASIDAQTKALTTDTAKLVPVTSAINSAYNTLGNTIVNVNRGNVGLIDSIQQVGAKVGNARPLVMSMSQAMQDSAQFSMGAAQGIRAVANNVEMMVQQMTYLKSSGMSVGEIFGALRGSLMGPMGILFAFSAFSAAMQWVVQGLTKTKAELKATQEQTVKAKEDFVKLSAEIKTMFPNDKRVLEIIVKIKKSLVDEAAEIEEKMKKLASEGRGQETVLGIKTEYGELKAAHDVLIRQIQQGNLGLKERAQLVKFIVELAATGKQENVKKLLLSGGYTEAEIDGVSKALKAQFGELKIGTEAYGRYALAVKAVKDAQDSLDPEKQAKLIEHMYEQSYKLMRKLIDVRGGGIVDAFPGLEKNAEFMKAYGETPSNLRAFGNLQDVKRMAGVDVTGMKGVSLKSAGMLKPGMGFGDSLKLELDKVKPEAELFSNTLASGFREATNTLADGLMKALGLGQSLADRLIGTLLSGFLQLGMNALTGGLGSLIFDSGGWINEPVIGRGMKSGRAYGLALNGQPEHVSTANQMGQSGRYGDGMVIQPSVTVHPIINNAGMSVQVEIGNRTNKRRRY